MSGPWADLTNIELEEVLWWCGSLTPRVLPSALKEMGNHSLIFNVIQTPFLIECDASTPRQRIPLSLFNVSLSTSTSLPIFLWPRGDTNDLLQIDWKILPKGLRGRERESTRGYWQHRNSLGEISGWNLSKHIQKFVIFLIFLTCVAQQHLQIPAKTAACLGQIMGNTWEEH